MVFWGYFTTGASKNCLSVKESNLVPSEMEERVICFSIHGCRAFIAAFLSFFAAQVAKVFTHYYITREWDMTRLVGSGGMPSSHTALVMGLTMATGVMQGTNSPFFAISLVFSLIVSYSNGYCVPSLLYIGIINDTVHS
jgi:Na+/H+-translocating membrane pyrophosphatase